jgi:hypothetical protein
VDLAWSGEYGGLGLIRGVRWTWPDQGSTVDLAWSGEYVGLGLIRGVRWTWRQSENVWQRFCDRFLKRPLLTISRSFMNVANSVLWGMALILKANKVNLFVSCVLFVFWYQSPNLLDTPRRNLVNVEGLTQVGSQRHRWEIYFWNLIKLSGK